MAWQSNVGWKRKDTEDVAVDISKAVFNPVYLPYLEDKTPAQIYFGGASAGKSVFVVGQRTVYDLLRGKRNYLIIRNVARTSRTSTFNEVNKVIQDWGVSDLFHIHKTELTVTCATGKQALFAGLDDVEKLKSITPADGPLTDVIVEEATETSQDDVKQLEKRLRGQADVPKRLTLLFNPILKSHWIYRKYFQGRWNDGDREYKDSSLLIRHFTYRDNMFLSDDDIQRLENEDDPYFYKVYTLGHWGVLGGVIFTNWEIADLSGIMEQFDNLRHGLDFGFAEDPTAYIQVHLDKKHKRIYILREMYERGLTNPQIAERLKPWASRDLIIADSAEPKSIAELNDLGLNVVGARKGKDSVNHGIQWLKGYHIIIDKRCQNTINEFELYQWKKTRNGDIMARPVDKFNHSIDALRYALEDDMQEGGHWVRVIGG